MSQFKASSQRVFFQKRIFLCLQTWCGCLCSCVVWRGWWSYSTISHTIGELRRERLDLALVSTNYFIREYVFDMTDLSKIAIQNHKKATSSFGYFSSISFISVTFRKIFVETENAESILFVFFILQNKTKSFVVIARYK